MPFYGATADEAATQLVRWLTLATAVPRNRRPSTSAVLTDENRGHVSISCDYVLLPSGKARVPFPARHLLFPRRVRFDQGSGSG